MEVNIIDFGLGRDKAKPDNKRVGTAGYFSPETMGGVNAEVDERADNYDIGLILRELWRDKTRLDEYKSFKNPRDTKLDAIKKYRDNTSPSIVLPSSITSKLKAKKYDAEVLEKVLIGLTEPRPVSRMSLMTALTDMTPLYKKALGRYHSKSFGERYPITKGIITGIKISLGLIAVGLVLGLAAAGVIALLVHSGGMAAIPLVPMVAAAASMGGGSAVAGAIIMGVSIPAAIVSLGAGLGAIRGIIRKIRMKPRVMIQDITSMISVTPEPSHSPSRKRRSLSSDERHDKEARSRSTSRSTSTYSSASTLTRTSTSTSAVSSSSVSLSQSAHSVFSSKENVSQAIDSVADFISRNSDYFSAPFKEPKIFEDWIIKNESALALSEKLMRALGINLETKSDEDDALYAKYQIAIMGKGESEGIEQGNKTHIRSFLKDNPAILPVFKLYKESHVMDDWRTHKKRQSIDSRF
jgi:hypothetical protein